MHSSSLFFGALRAPAIVRIAMTSTRFANPSGSSPEIRPGFSSTGMLQFHARLARVVLNVRTSSAITTEVCPALLGPTSASAAPAGGGDGNDLPTYQNQIYPAENAIRSLNIFHFLLLASGVSVYLDWYTVPATDVGSNSHSNLYQQPEILCNLKICRHQPRRGEDQ